MDFMKSEIQPPTLSQHALTRAHTHTHTQFSGQGSKSEFHEVQRTRLYEGYEFSFMFPSLDLGSAPRQSSPLPPPLPPLLLLLLYFLKGVQLYP